MTPFPRDSGVQITAASTTLLRAVVVFVCLLGLPTDAVSQDLDTSLIQAAARGDLAAVQMMLAEGADAAATDSSGASAFMWGAYAGSVPVARALLDAGADPFRKGVIWLDESRRSYYGSPLAAAAGEGWLPSVRFLIEEIGLSVNDREWSPTDGEATGWTALQWAVSSDQIDIVRYLAARGADLEVRNRNGEPLLVAYADPGRLPVLKVLLEAGADVNATDPAGNSVLLYAMIADATEFVELLLSYGADPNRVRSDGATPLLFGIVNYATASVLQMLDRDIDLHRAGEYGTTPLHWAAMAGVPEVIDKMIVRGADLNVRDSTGATPLGHAAQASRYRAAETLLSRGADPSARESNGWAPLHYAAQNGHSRLIRALIDAGAEIDARSNNGLRPLDIAIDSLVIPPVEVLVCAGASLDMPDAQGRTPVERARHREREDLARDAQLGGWTEQERLEAEEYYVSMSTMLADPYCGVRLRTGMVANNDRFMSVGGVIVARQVMETILSQERLRLGEVQEGYAYLLAHFLWVHVEGGDRNEGLRLGERALELHRQLYQPDAPEMARVFAPLAALHLRDDQEVSQHYVQQGLRLTETSDEEWLRPRLLRTSARLLLDRGATTDALRPIEELIGMLEAGKEDLSSAIYRWWMTLALQLRAEALLQLGEHAEAEVALRDGVRFATEWKNDTFGHGVFSDYSRYLLDHAPDRRSEAFDLAMKAAGIVQRYLQLNLHGMSQAELRAFLEEKSYPLFGLLVSAAGDDAEFRRAYAYLHTQKGLLMQSLRVQSVTLAREENIDFNWYGVLHELRSLRRQIASHSLARNVDLQTIDSLTARKETMERSVLQSRVEIIDPVTDSTLADFQNLIRPGEALLDFYRYNSGAAGQPEARYGVAIVSRGTASIRWVDLGQAIDIEEAIARFRSEVNRGRFGTEELELIASRIWDPIVADLQPGVDRLWISPDGALARIPWSVVSGTRPATETFDLSVVDSPRELARLKTTSRQKLTRQKEEEILLVGDIDFGEAGNEEAGAIATFSALPGTRTEVDRLYALVRNQRRPASVIDGRDATRAVVADRLVQARYAHIATHGFFFREDELVYQSRGVKKTSSTPSAAYTRNPLIESGLALAGANVDTGGLFTAEEMIGLDLRGTELVVLSACDTGRGAEVTGQGVMGLRAALTAAGVRSLLMSLWKVPDESTAILMESFYRGLLVDGLTPVESLRRAQVEVRADPLYAEPVHWAAWVLAGEVW